MMIVNVSPTVESSQETLCSLRFAKSVNQTELGRAKKQVRTLQASDPLKKKRPSDEALRDRKQNALCYHLTTKCFGSERLYMMYVAIICHCQWPYSIKPSTTVLSKLLYCDRKRTLTKTENK